MNVKRPKFISLQEAGEILSLSATSVRRRISDGELTGYTIGDRPKSAVRVREDEVIALLKEIPTVRRRR